LKEIASLWRVVSADNPDQVAGEMLDSQDARARVLAKIEGDPKRERKRLKTEPLGTIVTLKPELGWKPRAWLESGLLHMLTAELSCDTVLNAALGNWSTSRSYSAQRPDGPSSLHELIQAAPEALLQKEVTKALGTNYNSTQFLDDCIDAYDSLLICHERL
jgi:hypothetical protein